MADPAAASSSAVGNKRKQRVVCISSSDDEDGDESDYVDSEEGEEEEASASSSEEELESDDEADDEDDDPTSDDDYESECADGDGDDDDDVDSSTRNCGDEEHSNTVINLLQRQRNLNSLKLDECKAYLRTHELRISGNKETCIKRIQEHWRIKDANGEKIYPKSSFVINCTGDVCKGDVVMFKQKVYEKFDKVKRGGGAKVLGKRIIVGRVVSESYGRDKQQHTFTIEVLWSKGVKPLPALSPLLVKGRNLYRLKTFRQPWSNEAERSRVLAEKHRRGAAARHIREIARSLTGKRGFVRKEGSSRTKAPPHKKRRKDLGLTTGKKKEKCSNKSDCYANKRKAVKTSNSGPSAARDKSKVARTRNRLNFSNSPSSATCKAEVHGLARARNSAKVSNSVSSVSHDHAKMKELDNRNSNSFATHSERPSNHSNGRSIGYALPERYSYSHNHMPGEVIHRNNFRVSHGHENRQTHHVPNYSMSYPSSAAGVPYGHVAHRYNGGYFSSVHGQIPYGARYSAGAYGDPAFQLDPRREGAFHGVSGGQFHAWRRP